MPKFEMQQLAKRGCYYGEGTYFRSQSCKAFPYSAGGVRAITIARVVLGNSHFATQVDHT